MGDETDVLVIGGGPAGLAAAIAVRKQGFDVIVADGAEPPIDKACGEGLMPDTLAALRGLGIEVDECEGYPFRGIRFLGHGTEVEANFPTGQGIGVRRPVLHQKLVEQACAAGVSFRWKTSITGLHPNGVVVGRKVLGARWIVGADGIRSRVRRWAGLEPHTLGEPRYAFRRHYCVKPWSDCMELYWGESAQAYVTPVGRHQVCIVLMSRDPTVRFPSIETHFPRLAKHLAQAASAGTERGAVTLTRRFERVYCGRVVLIGDASGTVDAITGEGLRLNFDQAKALADALKAGDLGRYQAAHRRLARRPRFMGHLMLMLDRHPELRARAMRAMAANPEVFARLLAIHVGATSPRHLATTGTLLGWRFVAT
jgi:flavin-dependent dehydrogenase